MPTPDSLPNPATEYLASLQLAPPSEAHDPSFFDPPSSTSSRLGPIVEEAKKFIHALLPAWAENHVYRTYAFALTIAEIAGWTKPDEADRLGWDKELWFLVAILHDIGWDAVANLESRLSFEIFGGIKARELLIKWGAPLEVAEEVCESIIRHTDARAQTGGIRLMGALTQLGAAHDLIGLAVPLWIHPEDNRIICRRWPRIGLIDNAANYIGKELACKPGCIFSKWADIVTPMMRNVKCFEGLEGKPEDDEGWKARRDAQQFQSFFL